MKGLPLVITKAFLILPGWDIEGPREELYATFLSLGGAL
jgi:hypothetical protein